MKLRLVPQHLPALLLLSSAALLVLKIGAELGWLYPASMQPSNSQQKSRNSNEPTLALKPEFVLPPLEQTYNEILTRPIFTPGRHPPASSSDAALPSAMRKGQFTLVGVILTEDRKIALLHEITTNKIFRVEQGKEINGMQLEKLEPEKITLKQGEEREDLPLKIQPSAKQQLAATPPPGSPANPEQAGAPAVPVQAETPAVPVQANIQGGQNPLTAQQQYIARRRALHNRQQNNRQQNQQ